MDKAILTLLMCLVFVMIVCGVLLVQDVRWAFARVEERYESLCLRKGPTGGDDGSCIGYWKFNGEFVDLTER